MGALGPLSSQGLDQCGAKASSTPLHGLPLCEAVHGPCSTDGETEAPGSEGSKKQLPRTPGSHLGEHPSALPGSAGNDTAAALFSHSDPRVEASSPGSFPGPGSKGKKKTLPCRINPIGTPGQELPPAPQWGVLRSPPAAPRGPGLGRILPRCVGGEQARLYSRRFDPREAMKSRPRHQTRLSWAGAPGLRRAGGTERDAGRASLPARPETTLPGINSPRGSGVIGKHRSQPCCQQLRISREGGTETRGQASRGGRRKKIRGRTVGRKRAGENAAPFPPQPCPRPSGKRITLPPPPSPSPRGDTP